MKSIVLLILAFLPFILIGQSTNVDNATSWSEVIEKKEGNIVFYWYPSKPFIYSESNEIVGIEYELANSFVGFLEKKYLINLDVKWVKAEQFDDVIFKLKDFGSGVFGVSSLSITPERARMVKFTTPYIPDISVLVSTSDIEIAQTKVQFNNIFNGLTAITVQNSTLESELLKLRDAYPLEFDIVRIDNAGDIVGSMESMENSFGYVDLPTFLSAMRNGTGVKRQFFYPIIREGLSLTYTHDSDWEEPILAYFESENFERDRQRIISKYLGDDVTELIQTISNSAEFGPYEEIVVLTQEKELQYKELLDSALQAQKDQRIRNLLIGGIAIFILIAILFISRYNLKSKANLALAEKQQQMAELNEEKYNLIKVIDYDLRVSLTKISGLSRLYILENDPLTEDQQKIIEHILHTSDELGSVIGNILDFDASEAAQLNLKFERINLNAIIENVIDELEDLARENGVGFKTTINSHSFVKGDSGSLRLVLENILTNAINSAKKNTTITVGVKDSGKQTTIAVTDQGGGLSEEERLSIFDKSYDGMGLSIVKMYMDLMKGSITCESEPGKGTTFFLSFDIA